MHLLLLLTEHKHQLLKLNMLSWEHVEQETATLTDFETSYLEPCFPFKYLRALHTISEAGTGVMGCVAHLIWSDFVLLFILWLHN